MFKTLDAHGQITFLPHNRNSFQHKTNIALRRLLTSTLALETTSRVVPRLSLWSQTAWLQSQLPPCQLGDLGQMVFNEALFVKGAPSWCFNETYRSLCVIHLPYSTTPCSSSLLSKSSQLLPYTHIRSTQGTQVGFGWGAATPYGLLSVQAAALAVGLDIGWEERGSLSCSLPFPQ